jgi:hypothetical protein
MASETSDIAPKKSRVAYKKTPGLADQASRHSMHAFVVIVPRRCLTEQEE